jgi:hypothetical protein
MPAALGFRTGNGAARVRGSRACRGFDRGVSRALVVDGGPWGDTCVAA